jgi:hypothetical protein
VGRRSQRKKEGKKERKKKERKKERIVPSNEIKKADGGKVVGI